DVEDIAGEYSVARNRHRATAGQAKERGAFQNPEDAVRTAPPPSRASRGSVDLLQTLGGPPGHRHATGARLGLGEQFPVTPSHGILEFAESSAVALYLGPLRRSNRRNAQVCQPASARDPEIRCSRRQSREIASAEARLSDSGGAGASACQPLTKCPISPAKRSTAGWWGGPPT